MAQLPRYQRLGVRTRQPGSIDFADTREQARYSQNLSQQLDRMSQFAFKEASRAAEIRGQERVRDEGAVETLEAIDKKGGAFSIADQAAYELGSRVAVAEIQNTAEIETMRILNDAERNETPFSRVQDQLLDLTDGYSESLRVIDPTAAAVLRENLNGVTAKATERYSNWYVNLQAQKQKVKAANAADLQYNNIIQGAILPGSNAVTIKQQIAKSVELLGGLALSEKQLKAFELKAYNDAIKENYIFNFNSSPVEEQEIILKRMETIPAPGMTLQETQSFRKSLQGTYNKNNQIREQKVSNVVSLISEQDDIATAGGIVSQKMLTEIEAQLDAFGPEGDRARAAYERMTFDIDTANNLKTMMPADLARFVTSIETGLPGVGEPGRDTDVEVKTYDFAVKMLDQFNKDIEDNPISAAVKRQLTDDDNNLIQIKPIDFNQDPNGVVADLSLRFDQAKLVSKAYGTPLTLFTKEETKLFSNALKSASLNDRLIALESVAASGDAIALQAFEELAGTDGAFYAAVGASMVSGNRDVATRALQGQAIIEAMGKPKLTSDAGSPDADSISNEVFRSVFGETLDAIPAYRAMAENLYAFYAEGATEFNKELWINSLNQAVGFNPDNGTGGIDTVRSVSTLIPSGNTALDVSNALTEMDADILSAATATGQTIAPELFEALSGEIELSLIDPGAKIYEVTKNEGTSGDYNLVSLGGNNYGFMYKDSGDFIDDDNGDILVFDLKKVIELTAARGPVYYTQDQKDAFDAQKDVGQGIIPETLLEKMAKPGIGVIPSTIVSTTTSLAETVSDVAEAVSEAPAAGAAAISELDEREAIQARLIELRKQFKPGTQEHKNISTYIQSAFDTKKISLRALRNMESNYQ
jgi:hypothetical protein